MYANGRLLSSARKIRPSLKLDRALSTLNWAIERTEAHLYLLGPTWVTSEITKFVAVQVFSYPHPNGEFGLAFEELLSSTYVLRATSFCNILYMYKTIYSGK